MRQDCRIEVRGHRKELTLPWLKTDSFYRNTQGTTAQQPACSVWRAWLPLLCLQKQHVSYPEADGDRLLLEAAAHTVTPGSGVASLEPCLPTNWDPPHLAQSQCSWAVLGVTLLLLSCCSGNFGGEVGCLLPPGQSHSADHAFSMLPGKVIPGEFGECFLFVAVVMWEKQVCLGKQLSSPMGPWVGWWPCRQG